jgi:hypothetical protein
MERVWLSRLRWRARGAWLAPALVVLTVGDAVLVHALPLSGDRASFVGALLLGAMLNLIALAAIAPAAGMLVRRLRPDLPVVVARNYAGTALVALITAALLTTGLLHHATVVRDRHALADALQRGQAWIGGNAPAEYRRHVVLTDIVTISTGIYRVCAPGEHRQRSYCVIVRTDLPFPRGLRFAGHEPNTVFAQLQGNR